MLRLRPLTAVDATAVQRLNVAARPGVRPLDVDELSRLMGLSDLHLVAEREKGEIVGYVLVFSHRSAYDGEAFTEFRRMLGRPFLYVGQIAVSGRERRRGVARVLYGAVEAGAVRAGVGVLCCEVDAFAASPDSMAFHRSMGFHGRGALRTSDDRTVELMVRRVRGHTAR
jgi:predicted GNAT superfamily acetyltransferase